MRQIDRNRDVLVKYGLSEELAQKAVAVGFTKSTLESTSKKELAKTFTDHEIAELKEKVSRQPIPDDVFERLVKDSELHCPFCWNLSLEPPIIVHHIDPYNETQDNSYNNLIVLCLNHHGEVHTKREISQSNYPKVRLLSKKEEWTEALRDYKAGKRSAPGSESASTLQKSKVDILGNSNGRSSIEFQLIPLQRFLETPSTRVQHAVSEFLQTMKSQASLPQYKPVAYDRNTLGARMGITYSPILFDSKKRIRIETYAQEHGIALDTDFFNLGQLERSLPELPFSSNKSRGTDEEKKRLDSLNELYNKIELLNEYGNYLSSFEECYYVDLVLSNQGKSFDEDIEVKLFLPKGSVLEMENFPIPERQLLLKHIDAMKVMVSKIFDPVCTHEILPFPEKKTSVPYYHYHDPVIDLWGKSVEDTFSENLQEFNVELNDKYQKFAFYQTEENTVISFKQDYLKHNNMNAFPSRLIFMAKIGQINYTITTKNIPDVISGTIYCSENVAF